MQRLDGMGHGRAAAVLAVFTVTVLGIFLGTGDPTNSMELFNLVPVREAFRDGNWLVPTLGGWPRLEKPPLCVWIPGGLAALVGSDSLWVVRIPSVVMAFLTVLGTYGIGRLMLRSRGFALLSAVMLAGMFAFDRHARLASYDIYAAAFTVGCAYFLVRLAETRATGWGAALLTLLSGLSLGLSFLAKGPAPAATVLIPLLVWLAVYHRRRSVWLAVGGVIVVGILTALPWVLAVRVRYPQAWAFWKAEFLKLSTSQNPSAPAVTLDTKQPWYYYLQAFIWTAPFVPLFLVGLCLPFVRSITEAQRELRSGRWLGWGVTVGGFVLLSIPAVKEQRYAVQLLPFAALVCGSALQACVAWLDRKHAGKWTTWRAGAVFILCAWLVAFSVNWINRALPANHTNAFRPGVEKAKALVGRSPVAVFRPNDIPPWLATAYYFDRVVPQLIVPYVVELAGKHPSEAVYVLEWSTVQPYVNPPSWQMDAVRTLTGRKTEAVMTFTAEGRRLTVTRVEAR